MNAEDGCTLALVNRGEREKNPIKVVYIYMCNSGKVFIFRSKKSWSLGLRLHKPGLGTSTFFKTKSVIIYSNTYFSTKYLELMVGSTAFK